MTKLVVEKSYFIFNILYKQKGSVEMNLPIGPTLANAFPCYVKKWPGQFSCKLNLDQFIKDDM